MRSFGLAFLALLLWSCGDDEAPADPETAPARAPETTPPPAPPSSPRCTRGSALSVAPTATVTRGVGIAVGDNGGLVTWRGQDAAWAVPIDEDGRPRSEATELTDVRGDLFTIAALDDGFVILFADRCEARTCLVAHYTDADGNQEARVTGASFNSATTTRKQASTAAILALAFGHEDVPPEVITFGADRRVRQTTLPAPAQTRTEILGLTAEGERWGAIYRTGAAETAESQVLLARPGGGEPLPVEALHDALAIESFAPGPNGLSVIASFEFSRPQVVSITDDGPTEPLLLDVGSLPPPFVGRRRARLTHSDGSVLLHAETGAGDPVETITVRPDAGHAPADIARVGPDAFLVAVAPEGGGEILAMTVRCE